METRLDAALAGVAEREFVAATARAEAGNGSREPAGHEAGTNGITPADAPPSAVEDDDATHVWPDEAAEAAFIAETRGRGEPLPVATPDVVEQADSRPLPSLDELVKRIPSETRELLDELFRVKFTTVRRVPRKALKE